MPAKDSKLHKSKNYWILDYHPFGKGERPHLHISQGDRELVILLDNLEIKHNDKKISKKELKEILMITKEFIKELELLPGAQEAVCSAIGGITGNNVPFIVKLIMLIDEGKKFINDSKEKIKMKIK